LQKAAETVANLTREISNVFDGILQKEKWLDDKTREAAREKLKQMYLLVDHTESSVNLTMLNEYYRSVKYLLTFQ